MLLRDSTLVSNSVVCLTGCRSIYFYLLHSSPVKCLHSVCSYMFFTDMGVSQKQTKLERAFMDGSNRVELVKSRLGTPTGITLDIVNQRVYWSDSHFDTVETVTYSGLDRYYFHIMSTKDIKVYLCCVLLH